MQWTVRFRLVLFTTFVLATQPLKAAEQNNIMTLDQAISLALERNQTAKKARSELESAQAQGAGARPRRWATRNTYRLDARQPADAGRRFDQAAFGVAEGIGRVPAHATPLRSPGRFPPPMVNHSTPP